MIRASDLLGLPVVDLVQAEKLGLVEEIILDPDARRIAAFAVKNGSLPGRRRRRLVPAQRVYAIGPEALTLEQVAGLPDEPEVGGLPTLGELAGRRVLSRHGKLLGSVCDVLIDEDNGQIIGYALDVPSGGNGVGLLPRGKTAWPDYVRAEAALRMSRGLIVTPDEALVRGDVTRDEMEYRRVRIEPAIGWDRAPKLDAPVAPVLVRGPAVAVLPAPDPTRAHDEAPAPAATPLSAPIDSHAA
jgi:uncharacterized protein YrrD